MIIAIVNLLLVSSAAPIVGHVGDGNFHCILAVDCKDKEEVLKTHEFVMRLGRYVRDIHGYWFNLLSKQ